MRADCRAVAGEIKFGKCSDFQLVPDSVRMVRLTGTPNAHRVPAGRSRGVG